MMIQQAVGVSQGSHGGVTLVTKKAKHAQRPGQQAHSVNFSKTKSNRKCVFLYPVPVFIWGRSLRYPQDIMRTALPGPTTHE